ncbi:transposase [Streptomyces sp. NPDC047917]|uniref:transposase n=1 Tax=Streptomyces sp. NPDC047917 TaxID=3365491 RepID=UPI00371F828C
MKPGVHSPGSTSQDWLALKRLPAYAPELNPVELLWSSLKERELANLADDHLADVADATEQGIHRIDATPRLPWSFLAHTGLTIHHHTHRTYEKVSSAVRRLPGRWCASSIVWDAGCC